MATNRRVTLDPDKVRRARDRAEITQVELAKRAGCSHTTIGYIEVGRRQPGYDLALRIAAALHVDLEEIGEVTS